MKDLVYCNIHAGIATVVLNNPPLNLLDQPLRLQLSSVLQKLESHDNLRALILAGAGSRAFCAGADLEEVRSLTKESIADFHDQFDDINKRLTHLPIPVIAAVNGYALGGGLNLALCCDVRLAAPNALFGAVGANIGLAYSSQALVRLLGPARAKEMAFTTRHIGAEEAERIGLCNRVVRAERLMEECLDMARQVAAKSPLSVRHIKVEMNRAVDLTEKEMHELGRRNFLELHQTADHREAIRAIMEKRSPNFGGN